MGWGEGGRGRRAYELGKRALRGRRPVGRSHASPRARGGARRNHASSGPPHFLRVCLKRTAGCSCFNSGDSGLARSDGGGGVSKCEVAVLWGARRQPERSTG